MRTIAVVLGGGVGSRVGLDVPKQMVKVAGRTILEHTIRALHDCDVVDELVLMMAPGWTEAVATMVGDRYPKLTKILEGGTTRNATTQRALAAIGDAECKVLVHDAVRPLLDERIVTECVAALDWYAAVDVVIPSADTIVEVDGDEVTAIPDRSRLRRGQTPQGFLASVLREAYARAAEDAGFAATDDCSVVLRYLPGVRVGVVAGAEHNIKVTHPVDLSIADRLFQLKGACAGALDPAERRHRLAGQCLVVLGGSYGIGAEIAGLAARDGAHVVAHGRSTTGVHVQSAADVAAALQAAADTHGQVDAVVLTAGVLHRGRLVEMDATSLEEMVAVNYVAAVRVARAAYPFLRASRGQLLLFTSSSYTRGRAEYAVYSSTKAALVNLTQALAEEWSGDGIRVNVVNPERTSTPMRTKAFGVEPPGTMLSAEAVAQSCLDLLAGDGTGLVVDVRLEASDSGRHERELAGVAPRRAEIVDEPTSYRRVDGVA